MKGTLLHCGVALSVYFNVFNSVLAQADTLVHAQPVVSFSGFLDIFYCYDFGRPSTTHRQNFLFNYNRHNAFHLNLGVLRTSVSHPRYRGSLALHAGTYVIDNYSAEPDLLRPLHEASCGIALDNQRKLWLDAGIIPSHIGFESAGTLDNWTLTRSLAAENSPYYLAGAKLSYRYKDAWTLAFLICNGWQRIQRVEGNSLPGFGTQINYTPSSELILNWSTFIGSDDPDSTRRMRYFSNVYAQVQVGPSMALQMGLDVGLQESHPHSHDYYTWFSPVIIARYHVARQWDMAFRAELYRDADHVIVITKDSQEFTCAGLSFNLDYSPEQNVLCRIEGRLLQSNENLFARGPFRERNNVAVTSSLAMKW